MFEYLICGLTDRQTEQIDSDGWKQQKCVTDCGTDYVYYGVRTELLRWLDGNVKWIWTVSRGTEGKKIDYFGI
jgi:hypothetical protein